MLQELVLFVAKARRLYKVQTGYNLLATCNTNYPLSLQKSALIESSTCVFLKRFS